jgi:hypothetical protein
VINVPGCAQHDGFACCAHRLNETSRVGAESRSHRAVACFRPSARREMRVLTLRQVFVSPGSRSTRFL